MSERLDNELNIKAIAGFAIGLLVVTAASGVGLWYFSKALRSYEVSQDPPPPALAAARAPYLPPEPRLQTDPEGELATLRAAEDEVLEGYAWVDQANGIARVPIERAITLMVGDGRPPTLEAAPADTVPEEATH
jgi:hypothetical protein